MSSSEFAQESIHVDGYFEAASMMNQHISPFVLRSMVSLGVFDILHSAGTPLSLHDIVSQIKREATPSANVEDIIHRLLNYLVAFQVLDERPGQHYSLNKVSSWFVKAHPHSLAPALILLTSPELQASWQVLHKVALEGGRVAAFEEAHGMHLYEMGGVNPEFNRVFNEGMTSLSSMSILTVVRSAGKAFAAIHRLIDVGGGNSYCISKIIETYPHIQGAVFDLPHVIAKAPKSPGIEYLSGDMFESVPPGADGIFLKSVLHNWNDEKCRVIVKNCYDALPHNGKLIIVDVILNPMKRNRVSSVMDVMMIADVGGRERTEDDFKALLIPQGFSDITFTLTPSYLGILEACKK